MGTQSTWGLIKMKITILFLAVISLAFVSSNQMCREMEVKVYSSMQPIAQSFKLDVMNIKGIEFKINADQFNKEEFVPLDQVGFVLEKTENSKVLDTIHHKYLRNEPESVWMPYAFAGDWGKSGFVITNQMKRTSTSKVDHPLVGFEFVNDFELETISAADMDILVTNLRYNSEKRKIIKTYIKGLILKYSALSTTSTESLKAMKAANFDKKAQIASLTILLQKTVREITTSITTITQLEGEVAVKASGLATVNSEIDDIISKIAILNARLRKEELEFTQIVPKDRSYTNGAIEYYSNLVEYPQTTLGKFLDEYSISSGEKFSIVSENYAKCIKTLNLIGECQEANFKSSQAIKRKLRKD